jgi:hypothetical protein
MFRITSESDKLYLTEITYNGSNVLIMCVVGVWRHVLDLWSVCVRCAGLRPAQRTCRQTPSTHILSTTEPLYVISVNYRLSLPDDGPYVIRNMLRSILMRVF